MVDFSGAPGVVLLWGWGIGLQRLEGPPLAVLVGNPEQSISSDLFAVGKRAVIGGTEVDPAGDQLDLVIRQLLALVRNVRLGLVGDHPVERALGMPPDDDGLSLRAALDETCPGCEVVF